MMELQRRGTDQEDVESAAFLAPRKRRTLHGRPPREEEHGRHASSSAKLPGLLFAASWVVFLAAVWVHRLPLSDKRCVRQLNVPSPLHDVIEFEDVQFDNAFHKPSPYKGRPTKELEERWKDLWYYGSFDLPDSALPGLRKPPGGTDGHPWARTASGGLLAGLEVFHNLHCLNLVRQYVHRSEWDYSTDPGFSGTEQQILDHVDHCIEALRIRLMCSADVTPFLHLNTSDKGAQPDFDTQHRCPRYGNIVDWAKQHQIMRNHDSSKQAGHG
ncbi:hypothetical protein RB597_005778 [Gaeumannomyces tritici]